MESEVVDTMTEEIRDNVLSNIDLRFTMYNIHPKVLHRHPVLHGAKLFLIQYLHTLFMCNNMITEEHIGRTYYWVRYTTALAVMFDCGVTNRKTLQRWFIDILDDENPLLYKLEKFIEGRRCIYYAPTEEFHALFRPDETRLVKLNNVLEDNGDVEDPFTEEFKLFWKKVKKIEGFSRINMQDKSGKVNKYALSTQTYWNQLLKGTFSKTNKFPELTSIPTEEDILSAIQFCTRPDGTAIDGVFVMRNFNNKSTPPKSPVLEWLAKYQRGLVMEDGSEAVPVVTLEEMERKHSLYRPDYIWDTTLQGSHVDGSYTILAKKLGMEDGDERINRIHCDLVDGLPALNEALKEDGFPEWGNAREIGKLYLDFLYKERTKKKDFNLDSWLKNTVPWNNAWRDNPVWFNFAVWVYFEHNKMVDLSKGMKTVRTKAIARKEIEY